MDESSETVGRVGENDPLLSSGVKPTNRQENKIIDPDTDDSVGTDPNIVLPKRRWIVEPIALLFCTSVLSQSSVLSQYVYYRVGLQYNVSAGGNGTARAFVCDPKSLLNSSEHKISNLIQDEASSWTLYRSIIQSLVSLLVIPLYTSTSDYLGRKPSILLPTIGSLLDCAGMLVTVLLDLPLASLVLLGALGSLGGGFATLLASIFSYLADTTSRKLRPLRVALVEAMLAIGATVIELVMGWWMKLMGYSIPMMFSAGVAFANVLYVMFLVPEVRLKRRSRGNLLTLPFTNIASLFGTSGRLAVRLGILLAVLGLYCISFMGSSTLSSLYQMNYPFCLDSVFIGYLNAAKIFGYQIGATVGLLILRKYLGLSTITLIVIGLFSSSAGWLVTGLAQSVTMLFAASAVSMFAMLTIPLLRAYMSQLSPTDRQGALFGCVGVLQILGELIGSVGLTLLYKATLAWMSGFAYIITAVVTTVALLLTCVVRVLDSCWPMHLTQSERNSDDVVDANSESANGGPIGSINS